MIVPTLRLLVCYGLVIPPLTLLPFFDAGSGIPVVAGCLVFTALALLDGALAGVRSRGIVVEIPSLVRLTKGREGSIEMEVRGSSGSRVAGRLGLPLPEQISTPRDSLGFTLPKGGSSAPVTWPCTPLRRGRFVIDGWYRETRSFLGLWAFRKHHDKAWEIRVYPDLAEEGPRFPALFLDHGSFGLHSRRQQGKGREFERLRDYAPGDGYDEISWKATAKRHHPVTKVFQIERTKEVYVCIDASRLSGRLWQKGGIAASEGKRSPSTEGHETLLDRFIGAGLILGLAAQKQGDLFGMAAFDESVHAFVRAARGRSHYTACREGLVNLQPRLVNPDFEELFTFVGLKLRRRALIMMLTSLDDPLLAETFVRAMELVCRDHLVCVTMLRPEGARPIFSNPDVSSVEGVYDELSGHTVWHNLRELRVSLRNRGVHLALADREQLCVELVSQYMSVKQRQLL